MATVSHLGLFPKGCLPTSNPIDEEIYKWVNEAFECNLTSAMALYWRIKKVKLTITAHFERWSYDNNDPPNLQQDYSIEITQEGFITLNNIESEKELVCGNAYWEYSGDILGNLNGGSEELIFRPTWVDGDTYYVAYPFIGSILDPNDERGGAASIYFGFPPAEDPYWFPVTNVTSSRETIDFGNNVSFETTVTVSEYTLENSEFYVAKITDWALTVEEWWGYDPNDGGGPIYNTSTGERIRFDV